MKRINFKINNYQTIESKGYKTLVIEGQKLKPPSKRITLNQTGIKILRAKIVKKDKKGDIEYGVARINAVKSFGEIRLHTNNIMYPGNYEVTLEFAGQLDEEKLTAANQAQ